LRKKVIFPFQQKRQANTHNIKQKYGVGRGEQPQPPSVGASRAAIGGHLRNGHRIGSAKRLFLKEADSSADAVHSGGKGHPHSQREKAGWAKRKEGKTSRVEKRGGPTAISQKRPTSPEAETTEGGKSENKGGETEEGSD